PAAVQRARGGDLQRQAAVGQLPAELPAEHRAGVGLHLVAGARPVPAGPPADEVALLAGRPDRLRPRAGAGAPLVVVDPVLAERDRGAVGRRLVRLRAGRAGEAVRIEAGAEQALRAAAAGGAALAAVLPVGVHVGAGAAAGGLPRRAGAAAAHAGGAGRADVAAGAAVRGAGGDVLARAAAVALPGRTDAAALPAGLVGAADLAAGAAVGLAAGRVDALPTARRERPGAGPRRARRSTLGRGPAGAGRTAGARRAALGAAGARRAGRATLADRATLAGGAAGAGRSPLAGGAAGAGHAGAARTAAAARARRRAAAGTADRAAARTGTDLAAGAAGGRRPARPLVAAARVGAAQNPRRQGQNGGDRSPSHDAGQRHFDGPTIRRKQKSNQRAAPVRGAYFRPTCRSTSGLLAGRNLDRRAGALQRLQQIGARRKRTGAGDVGPGVPEDGDHFSGNRRIQDGGHPANTGGRLLLVGHAELADEGRDVVGRTEPLHLVEETGELRLVGGRPPAGHHLSPRCVLGETAERVRRVVVHRDEEPVRDGVLGQLVLARAGLLEVGAVAGDDQEALVVVPACLADGVDEQLVHPGERRVRLRLRPLAAEVRLFVERLEDQLLVLAREESRDLLPVGLELLLRVGAEGVGLRVLLLHVGVDPAAVPVDVEDAEHAGPGDP